MKTLRLALLGDLMLGRGIDQVLRHPSEPVLYEPWLKDAREYVALAESVSRPIPRGVPDAYVWGEALPELLRADVRLANLETAITRSDVPWPDKEIHYRLHPGNAGVLSAGGIELVSLANNHVLDWSRAGLEETLEVLARTGISYAGSART